MILVGGDDCEETIISRSLPLLQMVGKSEIFERKRKPLKCLSCGVACMRTRAVLAALEYTEVSAMEVPT